MRLVQVPKEGADAVLVAGAREAAELKTEFRRQIEGGLEPLLLMPVALHWTEIEVPPGFVPPLLPVFDWQFVMVDEVLNAFVVQETLPTVTGANPRG
jgi:hypothetical protein